VRKICIVGDRFRGLERHERVSTLSAFTRSLGSGALDSLDENLVLVAGDGVGPYEWDHLAEALARRGLEDRITIEARSEPLVRRGEAHKHRESNILVAGLHRVGEGHFAGSLRVHNDNELLLDHQTGQHVQGMVSVEAARQMFLAVTERYYASVWPQNHYYYVLNSMNVTFENFLFPIGATLDLHVERADVDRPERLAMTVRVDVSQAGRRCASVAIEYTAFESSMVESKETRRAEAAVDIVLDRHAAGDLVTA
jgi:hypothetical protein